MASIKYTNNAKTTLAADLNNSATSATVVNGNLFPSLSSGEHFYCTFDDGTNTEIVKVTARSTHVLTIVRAQDNTSARAFSSGDKAELRITAVVLEEVSTSTSSWNTDIFAGDGSDTTFTLTQAATDEKYLQVYIDGAFQAHNTYSVSGTTLTFATAPANSRVITVYHIEPVALGTADTITATANNSANETVFPVFVDGATGTQGLETDTGFTYNPSSGVLTIAGELDAGSLDISGNADIDGTLEADAITVNGVTLAETISDTVGAMVSSNTESGIAVTYDDSDNTLDFTVGTLNQNTTGSAATLTTARAIAVAGDVTGTANFDGSAAISITTTLANDAIVTANITNANVTVAKMAANSIDSDQYVDGSIDTAHIADSQITVAKMAANSVDSDQYVDGSIDTAHIADSQITSAKIADGTIATADIADNAITLAKMASGTDGNIISFDASGNPVAIATGSDGQVLTSTGAGSPPAFENAAGGGPTFKAFGTGSIMVGDDATGTIDAADNNTGLGVDVFAALTSGDGNTAVGAIALDAITTSADNTAVGHQALTNATSGAGNTAIGKATMTAVVTGSDNTAVGRYALSANTSASNNVAVGQNALVANTTGASNTALGQNALGANISASFNTAVGTTALAGCTTGAYNTAVGQIAMDALTTGNFNTALGRNTFGACTTASSGVAVGINALMNITTGGLNTAVGDSAGQVVTDGTHNCFFGYLSCPQAGDTGTVRTSLFGSNLTSTGSYAYGLGSNMTCDAGYTTLGQGTSDIRAANGTASWATVSDERVKKDIKDSTVGLAFINDLRPVTFNYRNKGEIPKEFHGYEEGSTEIYKYPTTNHGFIAQEVKEVIDNHTEIADGFKMWDIRATGQQEVAEAALIPMLVKALQEADDKIDALTARIETLEG
jgi:cytoskeletal protein CcmA (bactofilin family)